MTNPGPWTPPGSPPQTKQRFAILDMLLIIVMIGAAAMCGFALLFAIVESDDQALVISLLFLATVILSGLGRVVVHIAQTLDRIAAGAAAGRAMGEWHAGGRPTP